MIPNTPGVMRYCVPMLRVNTIRLGLYLIITTRFSNPLSHRLQKRYLIRLEPMIDLNIICMLYIHTS